MDALSQMLLSIRLQGAAFVVSNPDQRCYLPPVPRTFESTPTPRSECVMAFHLVTEGRCVTWLPGGEPIELVAGDLALFVVGDTAEVIVSGQERLHAIADHIGRFEAPGVFTVGPAKLIFGYVQSDDLLATSVMRKMPKVVRIKSSLAVTTWLRSLMTACVTELGSDQLGSSIIAERMAELLLLEAIRHYVIENTTVEHVADIHRIADLCHPINKS